MNIFVLDTNPASAARFHNDRHVVKMILESAQLLSSAHVMLDSQKMAEVRVPLILRPTHMVHPCAKWVRESMANYQWLHSLMGFLLVEYRTRYGKQHQYGGDGGVWQQLDLKPMNMPIGGRTPWPLCMPAQYRRSDPVLAYRLYYFGEKQHLAAWRMPARTPDWWHELEELQRLMPNRSPDSFRSYV